MAQQFPYTYYNCACLKSDPPGTKTSTRGTSLAGISHNDGAEEEDEGQTFDPRSPYANYSLFPLEQLLYCADCKEIRCSRCVNEEIVCWFCPNCQVEAGSQAVRGEVNRCQRNCFNCPVCTSPLSLPSLQASRPAERLEPGSKSGLEGPFFFMCSYCRWTSLEVGIEMEKYHGLSKQLSEMPNGGFPTIPTRDREKEREKRQQALDKKRHPEDHKPEARLSAEEAAALHSDNTPAGENVRQGDMFWNLAAFYKYQINKASPSSQFGSRSSYLTRLMALSGSTRREETKQRPMPEARNAGEGLTLLPEEFPSATIDRLRESTWNDVISLEQANRQLLPNKRFSKDLRPIPTLLRTKRLKRCRGCRSMLARPENKVTSTRYKIKLLAVNQIPRLSLRYHAMTPQTSTFNYKSLQPLTTIQFLLTIANPLFDPICVTLGTPAATTPSPTLGLSSKVTILCPQFEVGANTDVWDEALGSGPTSRSTAIGGGADSRTSRQAEAGKVWEKGRNWTSVIVEVVPGGKSRQPEPASSDENARRRDDAAWDSDEDMDDDGELDEDEDLLEIPVFVRIEYETELTQEERAAAATAAADAGADVAVGKEGVPKGKVRREEAFWCVLGAGRMAI